MSERLSAEQVAIIVHALGGSHDGILGWRNYYCVEDGQRDCEELVSLGLLMLGQTINEGRDRYYRVTDKGKGWIRATGRAVR